MRRRSLQALENAHGTPAFGDHLKALVNEGKLADAGTEFNAYLKLSPDGPNAATAKALVAQLPK